MGAAGPTHHDPPGVDAHSDLHGLPRGRVADGLRGLQHALGELDQLPSMVLVLNEQPGARHVAVPDRLDLGGGQEECVGRGGRLALVSI